jgi:hypothetical protein
MKKSLRAVLCALPIALPMAVSAQQPMSATYITTEQIHRVNRLPAPIAGSSVGTSVT